MWMSCAKLPLVPAKDTQIPVTIYGLANCDSVKKARAWLLDQGVHADFHDFKKLGLSEASLAQWTAELGWHALLNRLGTTWRKLSISEQNSVTDEASAIALMLQNPSLVKRPVVRWPNGQTTSGFSVDRFEQMCGL